MLKSFTGFVEVTFHEPSLGLIEVILPILVSDPLMFPVFPPCRVVKEFAIFDRERTGGSIEDVPMRTLTLPQSTYAELIPGKTVAA